MGNDPTKAECVLPEKGYRVISISRPDISLFLGTSLLISRPSHRLCDLPRPQTDRLPSIIHPALSLFDFIGKNSIGENSCS